MKSRKRVLYLTRAGLIAALYAALTLVSTLFGLSFGPIQLRLGEALCILPVFFPEAVPGLTLGCLLSCFFGSEMLIADLIFGTLATLIGAIGAALLRRHPFLAPLPNVLANTLILPPMMALFYRTEAALPLMFLTVGIGEALTSYGMGLLLYQTLRPMKGSLNEKLSTREEKDHGV